MAKWKLDEDKYPQSLSKAQKIIASQQETIDALKNTLWEIRQEYDPGECGANARAMYDIACSELGEGESG